MSAMNRQQLVDTIKTRQSFLIVGLDTDLAKMPASLPARPESVIAFNRAIIEATRDYCVGYKLNIAFYEVLGVAGWQAVEETLRSIPDGYFVIADAKRGDIGNTSAHYARTFFSTYDFDAVTVAPYMGKDSVLPFLQYPGKWAILLLLTSNEGSCDFQLLRTEGRYLYEVVAEKSASWGSPDNLMYVVGATHPDHFDTLRHLLPDHFILVPGIGAQGGDLPAICRMGMNKNGGLLINVSRSILYASSGADFAEKARDQAALLQQQMADLLKEKKII